MRPKNACLSLSLLFALSSHSLLPALAQSDDPENRPEWQVMFGSVRNWLNSLPTVPVEAPNEAQIPSLTLEFTLPSGDIPEGFPTSIPPLDFPTGIPEGLPPVNLPSGFPSVQIPSDLIDLVPSGTLPAQDDELLESPPPLPPPTVPVDDEQAPPSTETGVPPPSVPGSPPVASPAANKETGPAPPPASDAPSADEIGIPPSMLGAWRGSSGARHPQLSGPPHAHFSGPHPQFNGPHPQLSGPAHPAASAGGPPHFWSAAANKMAVSGSEGTSELYENSAVDEESAKLWEARLKQIQHEHETAPHVADVQSFQKSSELVEPASGSQSAARYQSLQKLAQEALDDAAAGADATTTDDTAVAAADSGTEASPASDTTSNSSTGGLPAGTFYALVAAGAVCAVVLVIGAASYAVVASRKRRSDARKENISRIKKSVTIKPNEVRTSVASREGSRLLDEQGSTSGGRPSDVERPSTDSSRISLDSTKNGKRGKRVVLD